VSRVRRLAATVVFQVLGGKSLDQTLPPRLVRMDAGERSLLQALCYTTVRWYHRLDFILQRLLDKPLKDREVQALVLVGLAQLSRMAVPPHAAVAETVAAAGRKRWARGLVNALLRNYLRRREELERAADRDYQAAFSHPAWLRRRIEQAWPPQAQEILIANNGHPPLVLRVNLARIGRDEYLQVLAGKGIAARPLPEVASAVVLEHPLAVAELPGFAEGLVSVQDGAAQLAAPLLDLRPGCRVLDVCAAPGGKTLHMVEHCPEVGEVVALDVDPQRLARIGENLQRLGRNPPVRLLCGDARDPGSWWDGRPFDRILVDAPCSGTGVIRRHPDIKLLRRDEDVSALAALQRQILDAVWPLLKPEGMLLYATCSILPEENAGQMDDFVGRHPHAGAIAIEAGWGLAGGIGRQILPGTMDGFYYARLGKCVCC